MSAVISISQTVMSGRERQWEQSSVTPAICSLPPLCAAPLAGFALSA